MLLQDLLGIEVEQLVDHLVVEREDVAAGPSAFLVD